MGMGYQYQQPHKTQNQDDGTILQSDNWLCLALCEVAQTKDLKKSGSIWVAPNEDSVITRLKVSPQVKVVGTTLATSCLN